jgi:hypothetical protein
MSRSQVPALCCQIGSGVLPGGGGATWLRFVVDAAAANPHRDGDSQEKHARRPCPRDSCAHYRAAGCAAYFRGSAQISAFRQALAGAQERAR